LTPTNLLYNVLATPGALLRFARERRLESPLTRALLAGTLPGVVSGAIIRVQFLTVIGGIYGIGGGSLELYPDVVDAPEEEGGHDRRFRSARERQVQRPTGRAVPEAASFRRALPWR
jgi:hypothetical protein